MGVRDTREVQAEAAYRANPIGAGIVSAGRGIPFVGEYLDEVAGGAASILALRWLKVI
jgi:hypothetical protein